jgi:inhibitor of cysteine peptidase
MRLKHVLAASLFIAVSVINAAETKKPVLRQAMVVEPTRITLDAQKENAQVAMKANREVIVSLAGSSTTGFAWTVVKPGAAAVVRVAEPVYEKGKSHLAGTGLGGTFAVKLTGVAKGTTKVYLEYVRPWETGVPPTKRMTLEVTVE